MTERSDNFIVLSWSNESCVLDSEEPTDFIYETTSDLYNISDYEERVFVGKFRLYYVDVERAINEEMPIFDIFDTYCHTAGYFDPIFGSNSPEFSDRLLKLLNYDVLYRNILILDRLEILPKYRGNGLGLNIMRHMMNRFGPGTGVVTLKPFPLQFEPESTRIEDEKWYNDLGLSQLPKDERVATKKLFNYYSRLGFLRIGLTPFMVRATDWEFQNRS